jgi:hypothetical protein
MQWPEEEGFIDLIGRQLTASQAISTLTEFIKRKNAKGDMARPTTSSVYVAVSEVLAQRYPTVAVSEVGRCLQFVAENNIQELFDTDRHAEMIRKLEAMFKECVRESQQPYHDALRVSFKLMGHKAEGIQPGVDDAQILWGEAIITCIKDSTEFFVYVRDIKARDGTPAEIPIDEVHDMAYVLSTPVRDALKFEPKR